MSDKTYIDKADVLVLGLGPVGIGILRDLRLCRGISIYGVVFNSSAELGRFSSLCKILRWSDPKSDEAGFKKNLLQWSEKRKNVIVFATRDEEVFWLAKNADSLPSNILYYRSSFEQIDKLANKILAIKTANSCGVKVPMSFNVTPTYENLPKNFVFPGIVKPVAIPPEGFPHKNMIVNDPEEFKAVLNTYPSLINTSILQEYIPGGDDQMYECAALVGRQGTMLGSIEIRKLRQHPVGRGISTFAYTLLQRELSHLSDMLIRQTGFRGLISFEFKKDYRNGQWIFIEANLRMPGYCSLFSCTDVNLSQMYISDLLGEDNNTQKAENSKKFYWMREELDLSNVINKKVNIGIFKWFADVLRTDAFAFCFSRDPMPGIVNLFQMAKSFFNSVRRRI